MSRRPYRAGRRGVPFGWLAEAGSAALLALATLAIAATAQPLSPVQPRGVESELPCRGTVVAELEAGATNSVQFYARQGEVFIVDAVDVSGSELLRLRLTGPANANLGSTCTGRLHQRAPVSGTYTLEVKDCIGNDASRYALSLNIVSDTRRNCAQPLPCGATAEGSLAVAGQVDSFAFYGARGDPVSLDFESTLDRRGGLEVRVFDPTGVAVLHTCGSTFDFNLPETGRYTVLVNACLGKNTGEYSLSWRSRSCPTHVGAHSGGGAVGLRLSNDGTHIVQLAASSLSCSNAESPGFVLDLNPPLPITGGRFSTTAAPQDTASNTVRRVEVDGVVVDESRTQLLGGMSILFGRVRCNFQWAATSGADFDWDGWSDDTEELLDSDVDDENSVPEDRRLPTTALFGPGVCRDRYDNDNDGDIDINDLACGGVLPTAPWTVTSYAGHHSGGGAFAIERSADGSRVTQLITSAISCGALEPRSAVLDVDIPISGNRFVVRDLPVGDSAEVAGLDISIDGVFFDGDGDGTRDQVLGNLIVHFGEECRYQWRASAHVDCDADGWGDVTERRYGSDEKPLPVGEGADSTPEHANLPQSALGDVGTCDDGVDNDSNGLTDAEDPKCPLPTPSPTPSRTPTATIPPTSTRTSTRTLTPSPTPTGTPLPTETTTMEPTSVPTSAPTLTNTIGPSRTPTRTLPPTPSATRSPSMLPTSTAIVPTSTVPPTSTPTNPTDTASPTSTPIEPTVTPPPPTAASTETPTVPVCVGDCDGNRIVTVDEVLRQVQISLGIGLVSECQAGDTDSSGTITVDEILAAVNVALDGCSGG